MYIYMEWTITLKDAVQCSNMHTKISEHMPLELVLMSFCKWLIYCPWLSNAEAYQLNHGLYFKIIITSMISMIHAHVSHVYTHWQTKQYHLAHVVQTACTCRGAWINVHVAEFYAETFLDQHVSFFKIFTVVAWHPFQNEITIFSTSSKFITEQRQTQDLEKGDRGA